MTNDTKKACSPMVNEKTDVHAKDNEGKTVLHHAAACGDLNVVKHLIDKGADVHARDNEGKTALHHAAAQGHLDVVKHLVGFI